MNPLILSFIAEAVAIIACCVGGAMGGYTLARPEDALAQVSLRPVEGSPLQGVTEARAHGGLLLLSHLSVAAALGYAPYLGSIMAATLAFIWLGAAAGRGLSLALDRKPGASTATRSLMILDLLMAAALFLPLLILYGRGGANV